MKFVEQDKNMYFPIHGDVLVLDSLPAKIYTIKSDSMRGLYLEVYSNKFNIAEGKLYGNSIKKADKIIRTYNMSDRNTGVIMSGEKGLGKTLCSKILCNKMIDKNYPVILCDKPFEGVADFLHKIEQECVVLFDEFEKRFNLKDHSGSDDDKPQEQFLSLFDGTDTGKKLFIITCNDMDRLNSFFVNRPGRFHYNIEFGYPSKDEIVEYMKDNNISDTDIDEIVNFSRYTSLNYDSLRAIAFELHTGVSFIEAMEDLNILSMYSSYDFGVKVVDKEDNYDYTSIDVNEIIAKNHEVTITGITIFTPITIKFNTNDLEWNESKKVFTLDTKCATIISNVSLKYPIKSIEIFNNARHYKSNHFAL